MPVESSIKALKVSLILQNFLLSGKAQSYNGMYTEGALG